MVHDVTLATRSGTLDGLTGVTVVQRDVQRIAVSPLSEQLRLVLQLLGIELRFLLPHLPNLVGQFGGGFVHGYFRTAERPTRTRVHIDDDAEALALVLCMLQHTHPTVGQETDFVHLVADYAIDRSNLDGTDASLGIGFQIICKVETINRRTHPPPTGAGLGFLLGNGPIQTDLRRRS